MNGSYPRWICELCGKAFGTLSRRMATYHEPDKADESDVCGWCGSNDRPLTEPRDWGYPKQQKNTAERR